MRRRSINSTIVIIVKFMIMHFRGPAYDVGIDREMENIDNSCYHSISDSYQLPPMNWSSIKSH